MIEVTLYSRSNCSLCDQAHADLESLQASLPHRLAVIDVDSDPRLREVFGELVPVVEVGPYRLKAPFSRQQLQMTLGAAADRAQHIDHIETSPAMQAVPQLSHWSRADAISYWLSRHYLAVFNLFILFYVGLPFLAPVLMKAGAQAPARLIYSAYSVVCHQLSYRSFFLFGEQPFYPRAAAGVAGILSFTQASGLSEASTDRDLLAARAFVGNPEMGYKVGLCERDVAIYLAILLFGVVYAALNHRLPALPWYLWLIFGILPIGLDGFSQLLSQPPFNFGVYRESTPFLRMLTGGLFGLTTAWFGYPLVEESMSESRQILKSKLARIQRWNARHEES